MGPVRPEPQGGSGLCLFSAERVWAARAGALVYSMIFAGFVVGIMVPLRLQLLGGGLDDLSDTDVALRALPPLLFFILIIRTDVTGRLPLIGYVIRAFRSAVLRKTIEGAGKRLEKLAAMDRPAATGA